jgi:hypothetical protein
MAPHQSNVKTGPAGSPVVDRKGTADMALDPIVAGLAVAALVILLLALFGAAAVRFGVDSRPGIEDRDRRPWLVPGA